jgi:hypothetical protein
MEHYAGIDFAPKSPNPRKSRQSRLIQRVIYKSLTSNSPLVEFPRGSDYGLNVGILGDKAKKLSREFRISDQHRRVSGTPCLDFDWYRDTRNVLNGG